MHTDVCNSGQTKRWAEGENGNDRDGQEVGEADQTRGEEEEAAREEEAPGSGGPAEPRPGEQVQQGEGAQGAAEE